MKKMLAGLCVAAIMSLSICVGAGEFEIALISKVSGIPFFDVVNDGA
jgi:hypothetical protein